MQYACLYQDALCQAKKGQCILRLFLLVRLYQYIRKYQQPCVFFILLVS